MRTFKLKAAIPFLVLAAVAIVAIFMPTLPNFDEGKSSPKLRAGMTLAIEPMVNAGTREVKVLKDGWTVVTKDGQLSAHFEHTVLVTEAEPEILTCPGKLASKLKVS